MREKKEGSKPKPKGDRFCLFCQKKIDESKPKQTRYCNKKCLRTANSRKHAAEVRKLKGIETEEDKKSKRGRVNEGRTPKYPMINLQQVEALAGFGLTDVEIALMLGVSESVLAVWRNKPEFLLALTTGKLKADTAVVKSMYQLALGGHPTAQIFWLKNRRRADWCDRQNIEHTGKDGGAIEIMAMTAEERRQRIQELEMKRVTELPGGDNDDR